MKMASGGGPSEIGVRFMGFSKHQNKSGARKLALAAAIAMSLALWAHPALGQTLTWDGSSTNPPAPNDGSGNWNTSTNANWSDGVSDFTWVNGDVAAIGNGGTAGTITIDDIASIAPPALTHFLNTIWRSSQRQHKAAPIR